MATNPEANGVVRTFTQERPTKNTVRYQEEEHPDGQAVGTLYIQKSALGPLGNPQKLTVTISAG